MKKSIFGYLEGTGGQDGLRLNPDGLKHEAWSEAILPADVPGDAPEGETNRRPLTIFASVGLGA